VHELFGLWILEVSIAVNTHQQNNGMGIAITDIYHFPESMGLRVMAVASISVLLQIYSLLTIVMDRCVRSVVELCELIRTLAGFLILPAIMLLSYIVRLLVYDSQTPDQIIGGIIGIAMFCTILHFK
jgi:hypothetical protein